MSDNKLLAENTIRRFMKLANVEGLTENFMEDLEERGVYKRGEEPAKRGKRHDDPKKMEEEVEETNEEINEEEEIDLEEEFNPLEEEEEMDLEAELGADDDMGDEMDAEQEPGAADMSLSEEEAQLLIDLGERLSAAMGGAEGAPDDDMDAMKAMDAMGDMDAEPEEDEDPDPAGRDSMMEQDEDDLVNEVLKRVTKRLVAEKLKNRK